MESYIVRSQQAMNTNQKNVYEVNYSKVSRMSAEYQLFSKMTQKDFTKRKEYLALYITIVHEKCLDRERYFELVVDDAATNRKMCYPFVSNEKEFKGGSFENNPLDFVSC